MVRLSKAAKDELLTEWMRSGDFPPNMTKPELRQAIDATDAHQETGLPNGSLPQKMRSQRAHKQKLFTRVSAKREGV